MKFKKVKVLILAEMIIVGGVLVHYNSTQAFSLIRTDYQITSPVETKERFLQDVEEKKEQRRIEEEERLRREQEEAERQRLLREEEERRRREEPHFNPYNVSELSNLSKEQMSIMLEGTALHTLVNAYYWYEQKYQINAVFMMALTAEESGWGRSSLAISNNNLSGHKTRSGEWEYYSDWGECLEESFRLISEEYVNPNGLFYTGASMYNINLVYCPDPVNPSSWADNISRIGYELLNKLHGGK